MKDEIRTQWLPRMLIGGAVGLLLAALCWDALFQGGFSVPALCAPLIRRVGTAWAMVITCGLFFSLGASAGVATLPFAESGRELMARSLIHFAVTTGLWALLVGVCFGTRKPISWLFLLGALALLYCLIWLGRWVGWYDEVAAIRAKLGLAPGPSLFHWRETLPYAGFALLFCLVLPFLVRVCDDPVPLFSTVYALVVLPVVGFVSGLSLGRRHGLCLIYPISCGLFILLFIPLARLVSNMADGIMVPIAVVFSLAGNALGAARRRVRGKTR